MNPEADNQPLSADAAGLCQRGAELIEQQLHDEALTVLDEAIRLDPALARAYDLRAGLLFHQGEHDRALEDLDEVLRLDPTAAQAHFTRGVVLQHVGCWVAAIDDYSDAIRLEPEHGQAHFERGKAHAALREYEDALPDLNEAIRRDPSNADIFVARGQIAQDEDDLDSALADYHEAVRLAPGNPHVYSVRGHAWHHREEFCSAVDDFSEALRLEPNNPHDREGRAHAWLELGEHDRANEDFDRAEQIYWEWIEMHERQLVIYTLLQNHFAPTPLGSLVVTERRFPDRVRADLQRAMERFVEGMTIEHFSGVRKQHYESVNLSHLLVRDRHQPVLASPPRYEELDIGEPDPVRCLEIGLWLLEDGGHRFAVLASLGRTAVQFEVAVARDEAGTRITQKFFKHLEEAVAKAQSYRGKVLSLEWEESYTGRSTGIKVHRLHRVEREQVILPRQTLALLERNVIQFVRQRSRLAELGMATKKGLLFYGPPGTGKTHTIHYLANGLPGVTTLLISAEQVGLLSDYMTLARLLQPSMVIIEDADLIARDRTTMDSACEEVLLNKLLNEMDGLKEEADVLFVLTTNRPEALEAALASRPGRIDQAIEFPFPDEEGRQKLVRLYARGMSVPDDVVRVTVRRTAGVSAAFIKELMRRAAQFSLERDGGAGLATQDVEAALEELLFSGGSLNRKLLGGEITGSV